MYEPVATDRGKIEDKNTFLKKVVEALSTETSEVENTLSAKVVEYVLSVELGTTLSIGELFSTSSIEET
ncbi:hypothetical protein NPIL_614941, partial [Nephila pilipes]